MVLFKVQWLVANKEEKRHFRRGTVVICVGSSSKPLYRNRGSSICACHAVFFHTLCTLWNQGCQMQTVWIDIEVRWDEDATTSCLFINSLYLGCNTSVDIVGVDYDPSLFENGTVALLPFSFGMCNAISMSFGVGKAPTARQMSWARLRKYSYCVGLTGRHHPPQGKHPVSATPGGLTGCSSFIVMPQSMMFFISGLWYVWFHCPLHAFPGILKINPLKQ